jgi:hypothetical protein
MSAATAALPQTLGKVLKRGERPAAGKPQSSKDGNARTMSREQALRALEVDGRVLDNWQAPRRAGAAAPASQGQKAPAKPAPAGVVVEQKGGD